MVWCGDVGSAGQTAGRSNADLEMGCLIDVATGVLTFSVNGKELSTSYQVLYNEFKLDTNISINRSSVYLVKYKVKKLKEKNLWFRWSRAQNSFLLCSCVRPAPVCSSLSWAKSRLVGLAFTELNSEQIGSVNKFICSYFTLVSRTPCLYHQPSSRVNTRTPFLSVHRVWTSRPSTRCCGAGCQTYS